MKKIISTVAVLLVMGFAAMAQQPQEKKDKGEWREKVRAEQVAMISTELELNEAEAQKFWPVYNEVEAIRREAYDASYASMKALRKAVREGTDTEKLLDEYLDAKKNCISVDSDAVKRYKKVLPPEKVAKLIITQEKFRHRQIDKMGHGGQNKGRKNGPQEGGPRQ